MGDRLCSPEVAAPTLGPAPAPRVRRRRHRPTCVWGIRKPRGDDEVLSGGTGAPWTDRGVQRGTGAARGLRVDGGSLEGVACRRSLGRVR